MRLSVNGEARELGDGSTVEDLVTHLGAGPKGVAVALNGEVVARSAWADATLEEGDRVEVLRAVGGG